MKAFLITEMPKCCNECKCNFDRWCSFDSFERYIDDLEQKPKWCPLRPLPSKRKNPITKTFGNPFNKGQQKGWNDCLDEILGETK